MRTRLTLCALASLAVSCSTASRGGVTLFEGLGAHRRDAGSAGELAQRYFDQGLAMLYAFNHDEALRAFQEVVRLEPECAMGWWGIAYACGPHINYPLLRPDRAETAWRAALRAQELAESAKPADRALIAAVGRRYSWPDPGDRAALDRDYAAAMAEAWRLHPGDADVGALYAEALMDLQPWDLWDEAGQPKGVAGEVIAVLEEVLSFQPDHPGANHFYIHAVEASPDSARALPAAQRLATLVPAASHLVHMPAHVYARLGRWQDATLANEQAVAADQDYVASAGEQDFYEFYRAHNYHFLAYACMMEGRREQALQAAREMVAQIPRAYLQKEPAMMDGFLHVPFHVMIRFGMWDEILEQEPYAAEFPSSEAIRRYARGVAYSATERLAQAAAELAAFDQALARVPEDAILILNPAHRVLPIARGMLAGELAFREGRHEQAFALLREAIAREDALIYDEPPGWMQPVRHALGALLLATGRAEESAAVYREDLRRYPANGWSLLGLSQALRGAGDLAAAAEIEPELRRAWSRADTVAPSSCYCQPAEPPNR